MSHSNLDVRTRRDRNLNSRLPNSWFSTYDLVPTERFPAWRESMGVFLDSSLGSQNGDDRFNGEIEGYLLDDIVFTRGRANRQKFDRKSLKIARDGIDHYMIELFLQGHAEMTVHGRTIRNRPGQIMGFDLSDIMDSSNSDFDLLCVIIPRARLAPLLARPDSMHGLLPDIEDGPGHLLAGYLKSVYKVMPLLTPAESGPVARALTELVAGTFNKAATGARWEMDSRRQSLLLRVQLFLRENIHAPDLSVERVTRNVGISRTALYELFEPLGGVATYVRELRLRKCLTEIMSSSNARTPISEIAYRWGFSSPAVFSRAFRHRFGFSPHEARATAHDRARSSRGLIDPAAGNRRHEEWIAGLF